MSLVAIRCPQCNHVGYVAASSLPRALRCSRCNFEQLIHQGDYRIERLDTGPRLGRPRRTPDAKANLDADQATEQTSAPSRP
jgi:hypothetical protein